MLQGGRVLAFYRIAPCLRWKVSAWVKALANEDTLLRTHCGRHKCFPVCPGAQHLLRTQILCPGHKKCFWFCSANILCPQQMFPSLRSPRNIMGNNVSATMCPRLPGPLDLLLYRCTRYTSMQCLVCYVSSVITLQVPPKEKKSQHKFQTLPMWERLSLILKTVFCFSQLEVEINELREKASKQTSMKTDDTASR